MFGIRLIFILAIVGGLIAYLGDWLGTKIGKGRMSLFGLRPRYTSILVAVLTGVSIAVFTIAIMAASSEEARTALFGVRDLQKQMAQLKVEADMQNKEIEEAHGILKERQNQLQKTQVELEHSQMLTWKMQEEVGGLMATRDRLESERVTLEERVKGLGEVATALEKNISDLREGDVLIRSGQILRTGVFAGGQSNEETQKVLNDFMVQTNQELSEEYKGMIGGAQGLLMNQESFNEAVDFLNQHPGDFAVRVLAAGNLYSGEPLLVSFDIFPNMKIYDPGEVIHEEAIIVASSAQERENQVLEFLRQVNEKAVIRGVRPDPVKGTVGAISLLDVYGTVGQLSGYHGRVRLVAKAKQTIFSPGPVRLEIQIRGLSYE